MDTWDLYEEEQIDLTNAYFGENPPRYPLGYTKELAISVCKAIATDTRSLGEICKDSTIKDFPGLDAIFQWRLVFPNFARNFNAAKKAQAQLLIDEIIEICEDPANCEPNILAWARERIKTRTWLASKLLPGIYGDLKQDNTAKAVTLIEKLLEEKEQNAINTESIS